MSEQAHSLPDFAAAWVLSAEGGYVDDPVDRGGATKYGISQRSYPDLDIQALTRAEALAIYARDYWHAYRCGDLPPALGLLLFDGVVQHRPKTAVQIFQMAVGVRADGLIGPVTLQAGQHASLEYVLDAVLVRRADLYVTLVGANSSQARFLDGWLARLFRLQRAALAVRHD